MRFLFAFLLLVLGVSCKLDEELNNLCFKELNMLRAETSSVDMRMFKADGCSRVKGAQNQEYTTELHGCRKVETKYKSMVVESQRTNGYYEVYR
jgi:hypothetical protein